MQMKTKASFATVNAERNTLSGCILLGSEVLTLLNGISWSKQLINAIVTHVSMDADAVQSIEK